MLLLKGSQVAALKHSSLTRFVEEMADHCAEFSPNLCRTLKRSELTSAVRLTIDNASTYGFTRRGPVRLYIDATLLLGSYFDTDPQYPWAQEVLADDNVDQMRRAEVLCERLGEYGGAVGGPGNAHARAALERMSDFSGASVGPCEDLQAVLLRNFAALYPEKYAYVGVDSLRRLAGDAIAGARSLLGCTGSRSCMLMFALMSAFGHQCHRDPLYPWILRALARVQVSRDTRSARLERRSRTWLAAVLKSEAQP